LTSVSALAVSSIALSPLLFVSTSPTIPSSLTTVFANPLTTSPKTVRNASLVLTSGTTHACPIPGSV